MESIRTDYLSNDQVVIKEGDKKFWKDLYKKVFKNQKINESIKADKEDKKQDRVS